MTTDTVKNAKMTTESVVNFVFFETLTTENPPLAGMFLHYSVQSRFQKRLSEMLRHSEVLGMSAEHFLGDSRN